MLLRFKVIKSASSQCGFCKWPFDTAKRCIENASNTANSNQQSTFIILLFCRRHVTKIATNWRFVFEEVVSITTSYREFRRQRIHLTNEKPTRRGVQNCVNWPIQFYWGNIIDINSLTKDFYINKAHTRSINLYNVEKLTIQLIVHGGLNSLSIRRTYKLYEHPRITHMLHSTSILKKQTAPIFIHLALKCCLVYFLNHIHFEVS